MTATRTQSTFFDAFQSLKRALKGIAGVTVCSDDEEIVIKIGASANHNDWLKAGVLSRIGWESWPVRLEGIA